MQTENSSESNSCYRSAIPPSLNQKSILYSKMIQKGSSKSESYPIKHKIRSKPIKTIGVSISEEVKIFGNAIDKQNILNHSLGSNIELPKNNLNLCFVGGVSTGKSTILNSIFCEKLAECKIKRTTMVPTIYIENKTPLETIITPPRIIFNKISEKNKELIEKSESGQELTMDDYKELKFNVGNLNMNILNKNCVNVYDIPGLNDARTKDIYYEYLETNFMKFNIIAFIIDIYSGLNTSDEMEMLQFIANNIKYSKEKYAKNVYTLVVINKADDMQVNARDDNSELTLPGELREMFEQVENTVRQEFSRKNIIDNLIGLIPFCAVDAYLYRMVKKHGTDFKLTPEQILKIGVNECGKRFGTLKPEMQEKKVLEVLSDNDFIDTMIKLSGFSLLENKLNRFLLHNDIGKKIIIDNLLFEINKMAKLTNCIIPYEIYGHDIIELFENHMKLYKKIKEISEETFHKLMEDGLKSILNKFYENMQFYDVDQINDLLSDYDALNENILKKFYSLYDPIITVEYYYNARIVNEVFERIKCMIHENKILINPLISHDPHSLEIIIDHLKRIGSYNLETIAELIDTMIASNDNLIADVRLNNTNYNPREILKVLLNLEEIGLDTKKLLKRLIIDRIQEKYNCNAFYVKPENYEELIIRNMIYQNHGEICIQNFIQMTLNVSLTYVNHKKINKNIFLERIETHYENPEFILDMYYLMNKR